MTGRTDATDDAAGDDPEEPGGWVTLSRSGELVAASPGAGLLLGTEPTALEGRQLSGLAESGTLPEGAATLREAAAATADGDGDVTAETQVRPAAEAPPRPVWISQVERLGDERVRLGLAERGLPAGVAELLDALEGGTTALREAAEPAPIHEALAEAAATVLGVTGLDVRRAGSEGRLERVAHGMGPAVDDRDAVDGTTPPYGQVWPAGETLATDGTVEGVAPGYDGVAVVPIGTHGTIAVGRVGRGIDGADVRALRVLVDHASSALNAVRHRETLETQRAALRRYETLVESIPEPVYATDERGQVTFVNRAFERQFGYDPAEGALHFSEFTTAESAARFREEISELLNADAKRRYGQLDVTGVTSDGRQRLLDASLGVIAHETDFDGVAGVLRDVTQRERRDEVSTVLQRALRHNLRTSINVIDSHAGFAEEQVDDDLVEHLETVREEAAWLLKLGETLRNIQQAIEPGPDTEETRPVREVIDPVVEDYADRYPEADIEVHYAVDAKLPGTGVLRPAIANVVENAIVHNDAPEPSVSLWVANGPETGWIDVHVEDDGPGMPAGEREILLGDAEITQLQHGSGIGLWVTRWMVDALDGELLIETDDGTVVTLRLRGVLS